MEHAIVSRPEWLEARKALLARERALTHDLDALRAERRDLPWVRLDKAYVFAGPDGDVTARRPLRRAQPARDLPLHARAGLGPRLLGLRLHRRPCRRRAPAFRAGRPRLRRGIARADRARSSGSGRGWAGASAGCRRTDSDFNYDFAVSFTAEDRDAGRALYNYGTPIRTAVGHVRHHRLRARRRRRRLPRLLDLPSRQRAADRRLQLARPRAQGPQRAKAR